ncbi:zf-HC2 domain-containing protein [candidate division KSB1 bacterium]|nr:zf-HC2 domain-containing protein [candidate division KSB1 bacterium]
MDNCQRFKLLVSDYIEGGLAQQHKQQMEYHFKECLKCARTTQQLRTLLNELKALPKVSVSPDFETILRARISVESALARRRHDGFFKSLQFRIPAYAISAVLIILGLFSVISKFDQPTRMAPPEAYVNQEWYGGFQQVDKSSEDLVIYILERKTVYNVSSQSPAQVSTIDSREEISTGIDSARSIQRTNTAIDRRENIQSPIY